MTSLGIWQKNGPDLTLSLPPTTPSMLLQEGSTAPSPSFPSGINALSDSSEHRPPDTLPILISSHGGALQSCCKPVRSGVLPYSVVSYPIKVSNRFRGTLMGGFLFFLSFPIEVPSHPLIQMPRITSGIILRWVLKRGLNQYVQLVQHKILWTLPHDTALILALDALPPHYLIPLISGLQ